MYLICVALKRKKKTLKKWTHENMKGNNDTVSESEDCKISWKDIYNSERSWVP